LADIKVYALSTCPYCKKAKALLKDLGASFEAVDVDLLPKEDHRIVLDSIDQLLKKHKLSVNPVFPVILKDREILVGFNETKIRRMAFMGKANLANFFRF
jgi:glutaredoxin